MPFQVLRHSSAEGVGFEPTMSAETLADTLAAALYARTDGLLKTAPETRMLQRDEITCGWVVSLRYGSASGRADDEVSEGNAP